MQISKKKFMTALRQLAVIMLGMVFLAAAILKGLDAVAFAAQISYLGLVREPWIVRLIAWGMIVGEFLLGIAILLGLSLRNRMLPLTVGVLIFFSAVLGWEWAFWNIQNCGCFGKYLPMTPAAALMKNLILLGLACFVWTEPNHDDEQESEDSSRAEAQELGRGGWGRRLAWRIGLIVLGAMAVTGLALVHAPELKAAAPSNAGPGRDPSAQPAGGAFAGYSIAWNGKAYDLARGTYLVAMLSESCNHCAEDVGALNQLAKDGALPPVVGLVLGEEEAVQAFSAQYRPGFPLQAMPVLDFLNLIGEAPPRFILVKDGRQITWWDGKVPPRGEIISRINSGENFLNQ